MTQREWDVSPSCSVSAVTEAIVRFSATGDKQKHSLKVNFARHLEGIKLECQGVCKNVDGNG